MATVSKTLSTAYQQHQAGQLQAAEQLYRHILQNDPNQPDALNGLGMIASQVGQHETAVELISRAIQQKRNVAAFHDNLGGAYLGLKKTREAVASFRRALALMPDLAGAHSNLGNALKEQGKLDDAIACYRQASLLRPDFAEAHSNLGNALRDQGKLEDAVSSCRRAIALKPNLAEAHCNLGNALMDLGKLDEALAHYHRATQLKPNFAQAYNALGNALRIQGKLDEALVSCRKALELVPNSPDFLNNLGNIFKDQVNLSEAVDSYRRALEIYPDFAGAHSNLSNVLRGQGKLAEAIASSRRALEIQPDFVSAHSALLFTQQYCDGVSPEALLEAHAEFDRRYGLPLRNAIKPHEKSPHGAGRIRLGFVSPDLGQHPVGYFLIDVLNYLRAEQFDLFCYSDRPINDEMTSRFQQIATQWRDVKNLSDTQLAEQIRSDRIEILFDLAGHTSNNRLLAFARKPAPIQITWLGYVGTTGLQTMDYILADRHLIPVEAESFYCEKVLRMPDDYACYSEPADAPPPAPLPAWERGYVTFGSLNNLSKITPQVVQVWAKILHRVPNSKLVIRYRGLDDLGTRKHFTDLFADQGIASDRLSLVGWTPSATRMHLYREIDLGLDPFPYSGATTTCDALWMGVPVVSCPFDTFASRQSLTHLNTVGLTETVARDIDDYINIAVALANDLPRLERLRTGLRERMAASPLCDGKRFTANLVSILRDVWKQHCNQ